jgi:hypothetical protein
MKMFGQKNPGVSMTKRVLDTLPDGYVEQPEGTCAFVGDLYTFKGRFVLVSEGSTYDHRVPPGTLYRNRPVYARKEPSEQEIMAALVQRGLAMAQSDGLAAILAYRRFPSACACMGPQNGDPLCSCQLWSEFENRRQEIHALVQNEMLTGIE